MSSQSVRPQYDSDLSDAQWKLVESFIPIIQSNRTTGGRPAKYDRREILNAILYIARTGCQWRLLPHDLPKWKTVYTYFVQWHDAGVFEMINARLRVQVRLEAGRNPEPTAGIIDSQSVKIVANLGSSGFDGAKKVNGRKRHIVTDTLGLLLTVVVHDAAIPDRAAAFEIIVHVRSLFKTVTTIFADQGYTGALLLLVKEQLDITMDIVKRTEARVFHILRKRWVVERTFGWFGFYRRLSKEYERSPRHSEAFVYIVMSNIMLHRLARGF
jgi:putative transposase